MDYPFLDRFVDRRYYTWEFFLRFLSTLDSFESFYSLTQKRLVIFVSFAPFGILTYAFPCGLMIRHLFITSNVPVT